MNRRTILKYTAVITGAAISAPLMTTFLSGCQTDPPVDTAKLNFFDETQFKLLRQIVDIILPATDSPAASEVGVHYTIDSMVGTVYNEEDQNNYKDHFVAMLNQLDKNDLANSISQLLTSTDEKAKLAKKGLKDLRQQTIAYYLNTEEVATKYLNYLPVPGEYQACISLSELDGKAWAI